MNKIKHFKEILKFSLKKTAVFLLFSKNIFLTLPLYFTNLIKSRFMKTLTPPDK